MQELTIKGRFKRFGHNLKLCFTLPYDEKTPELLEFEQNILKTIKIIAMIIFFPIIFAASLAIGCALRQK